MLTTTDTYLKQTGARAPLRRARRVAQPSSDPSRAPFACDSPQRPSGKRTASAAFEPGMSPCLIGSPTPAFSYERSAAQAHDKDAGGIAMQAEVGSPKPFALAAAAPAAPITVVPPAAAFAADAMDAADAAEQRRATLRRVGLCCTAPENVRAMEAEAEAAEAAEAAGALLLELLRPLQRAFEVASEAGGGGERALGSAMRSLGLQG